MSLRSRLALAALLTVALAIAAPASAEAAGFVARLKAPNHHPTANKFWRIHVYAHTRSGRPLRAVAWYQYLYNGQKVASRYPSPNTPRKTDDGKRPWPFKGHYSDPMLWPARSVGIPLTLRVVVKVRGRGIRKLDWKVVVRR